MSPEASPETTESTPTGSNETANMANASNNNNTANQNTAVNKPAGGGQNTAPQQPQNPQQPEAPVSNPEPTPEPKPELTASQVAGQMVGAMDASTQNLSEMPSDLYSGVYGIDVGSFSSVSVYGTMLNVKANEIIVIKAGGNIGAAQTALQNRKNTLLEQWKNYLPDQYELVQNGVIETRGDYVTLVIAQDQASALSAFRSAVN